MIWHALATYKAAEYMKPALVLEDGGAHRLYDVADAYRKANPAATPPGWVTEGVLSALQDWSEAEGQLSALATAVAALASAGDISEIAHGRTRLAEPHSPPQIFAAASNYIKHANEMGTVLAKKAESTPYMFIKASTAVIGPGETVLIPAATVKPDWEVELAAVIGKRTRRISVDDALDCVAGYTILNDVSARDLTRRSDYPFKFDWFQGKSFDTFAPLGPWIVPAAIVGDPQALKLGLAVNGEDMQDGTTAEMIFNVREQISYLSHMLTLRPGDVIATGTPTGVGAGRGIFLKPGDVMRAWVENVGELENPVASESA